MLKSSENGVRSSIAKDTAQASELISKKERGDIGPTIYRHLTSYGHYLSQTLAPIDEMPGHKRWPNYCCVAGSASHF